MRRLLHLLINAVSLATGLQACAHAAPQTILATPKPPTKFKKPLGDDNLQLPKGIKVTRLSPVFSAPNLKSKIVADVDVGTALIAREVSKRGAWIKVEDEDGNAGWMPRSRTNFNMLFAPEPNAPADPVPEPDQVNEARQDWLKEQVPETPKYHLHLTALTAGSVGGGATYSFFQRLSTPAGSARVSHFGAQVGAYRVWDFVKGQRTYVPFVRFRWLAHERQDAFASGPDLGVALRLPKKNWAGTLGYSWGWAPDMDRGGFALLLRPSVEIGGPTRFGIDAETGWFF